ncbi:MAG: gamma-glutamyl-gamma-aminobutyrate hydrolase family protein, partial [Bacilli bacterium]
MIIQQIKLCDGIILQGGNFSDHYEIFIAKYCYDNDIPILGICAGMNNMLRVVGGKTLRFDNIESHQSHEKYVHEIIINKESLLYKIIEQEKVLVNSRHKFYTSEYSNLDGSAYSLDGTIESFEGVNKNFYLAV